MRLVFGKLNTILMVAAIVVTLSGYLIMGTGENTISPILLVIAYAVLFPASIIVGANRCSSDEKESNKNRSRN
jgi:zinc transporter ZupT